LEAGFQAVFFGVRKNSKRREPALLLNEKKQEECRLRENAFGVA